MHSSMPFSFRYLVVAPEHPFFSAFVSEAQRGDVCSLSSYFEFVFISF